MGWLAGAVMKTAQNGMGSAFCSKRCELAFDSNKIPIGSLEWTSISSFLPKTVAKLNSKTSWLAIVVVGKFTQMSTMDGNLKLSNSKRCSVQEGIQPGMGLKTEGKSSKVLSCFLLSLM